LLDRAKSKVISLMFQKKEVWIAKDFDFIRTSIA
jgi:hypothetical protein